MRNYNPDLIEVNLELKTASGRKVCIISIHKNEMDVMMDGYKELISYRKDKGRINIVHHRTPEFINYMDDYQLEMI